MEAIELIELIGRGEDSRSQFKREPISAKDLAEEMVAFSNGTGGHIIPGLAVAREMLGRGWTVSWLMSPQKWKPGTLEPDRNRPREEAGALAAYVLSLPARKAKGARP